MSNAPLLWVDATIDSPMAAFSTKWRSAWGIFSRDWNVTLYLIFIWLAFDYLFPLLYLESPPDEEKPAFHGKSWRASSTLYMYCSQCISALHQSLLPSSKRMLSIDLKVFTRLPQNTPTMLLEECSKMQNPQTKASPQFIQFIIRKRRGILGI